jgi:hypothetical protein
MKHRLLAILFAFTMTAFSQTVPKNLLVFAEAVTDADTEHSKVGDYIVFRSSTPVESDGRVLAPIGSLVIAHVSKVVRPGKKNCKPGDLDIKFDAIELPSGDWAKLTEATYEESFDDDGKPLKRARKVKREGSFKDKLKTAALVPPFIALTPIWLPIAIANSLEDNCGGRAGEHKRLFHNVPYQSKTNGMIDNRWRVTAQKLVANMVKSEHQ